MLAGEAGLKDYLLTYKIMKRKNIIRLGLCIAMFVIAIGAILYYYSYCNSL